MTRKVLERERYTTGDLARLTGNTLRTVRYYEEVGVLRPAGRSEGKHRIFTRDDVARLRTITDLRAVGLSLEEVARVLKVRLRTGGAAEHLAQTTSVLDQQLSQVRERIATLVRVEKELAAARELLENCHSCPELVQQGDCGDCTVLKGAGDNALVSVMMARDDDAG